MCALNSYWRLVCVTAVALTFGWTSLSRADDRKDPRKGKDDKVIVIQLDASKLPPDVLKKLLTLSKSTATDDAKKGTAKRDDGDDKKPTKGKATAKKDDDDKKGSKGKAKKDDDDDKKGGKGRVKKADDDDDDDDKKRGKKKDD